MMEGEGSDGGTDGGEESGGAGLSFCPWAVVFVGKRSFVFVGGRSRWRVVVFLRGWGVVSWALVIRAWQGIPNYPLMSCICFSANVSISANKPLFLCQQPYFWFCICFFHKNALQIIPNISCILFTFNRIGSSCVHMSEIDGLGQLTSDDLWGLVLLHNKGKQFPKLILRGSFVPFSFVRHRNNI